MGYAIDELGPDRCREIAEMLFTVEKEYRHKLHGQCPIHGDRSASFVYHYEEDWYKCRSCGAGGDLVKLWCEVNNLDSHGDGFLEFKREFVGDTMNAPKLHEQRQPMKTTAPPVDVFVDEALFAALPPLPVERIRELRRQRGWIKEIIDSLDLREFDAGRGVKKIAIPVRDEDGRLCNVRLYQPGAERFKMVNWWDRVCHVCGGAWSKDKRKRACSVCGVEPLEYGRARLFPAPKQWKRDGLLWLCEGEPDTICALSNGLNACTQTAGCGTWRDEFSAAMAGRDVVIAYDADQAGWDGANQAAVSIAKCAKSVRVIQWPEIMAA